MTNITHPALALFALACFALSPQARAVCQDGCDSGNTFLGEEALANNSPSGFYNTAIGFWALLSNTDGDNNIAVGNSALKDNTTGNYNTATGDNTLGNNTTGKYNTATGAFALNGNSIGNYNTAIGYYTLILNTTGNENTATGLYALYNNGGGSWNVANGSNALGSNDGGNYNTANGAFSLLFNTTGSNNTADGQNALHSNTTGKNNTALGSNAGYNLTTGSNNIDIGNKAFAAESGKIRIGTTGTQTNTFIAGISGVTVAEGVGVIIDGNGHLGTINSSARYKEQIQPMGKASETLFSLEPVTFRYKHELDPAGIPQFGLVAEEVAKVNPNLVATDEQGKPYTVRYEAVNAMLLNEFLKEHRKNEEQGATIIEQQKQISDLRTSLKAVSERIDALTAARQ